MASLNLDEIHEVLIDALEKNGKNNSELVDVLINAFYSKVEEVKEEKKLQKENKAKSKKEWILLYNNIEDSYYIAQIGENEEGKIPENIGSEILNASNEYNETKKTKVYNIEGAFLKIVKNLKSRGIFLKTKEPVKVVNVNDDMIQG